MRLSLRYSPKHVHSHENNPIRHRTETTTNHNTTLQYARTRVCRDKTFVATKMILVAAPANDSWLDIEIH